MFGGNFDNTIPALGGADHAADGRKLFGGKVAGGDAVGGDHEILDDLRGAVLLLHFEVTDLIPIEQRFCLNRFQGECAMNMAEILQALGHLILRAQVVGQTVHGGDRSGHGVATFQPGCHAVIGQLGMVSHQGAINIRALQGTIGCNDHLDHNGQAVGVVIQGGEVGG